jgi:hypothetical protein
MIPMKDLSSSRKPEYNILILSRHLGLLAFQRENACLKTFFSIENVFVMRRRFHPFSFSSFSSVFKTLQLKTLENVTAEDVRKRYMHMHIV